MNQIMFGIYFIMINFYLLNLQNFDFLDVIGLPESCEVQLHSTFYQLLYSYGMKKWDLYTHCYQQECPWYPANTVQQQQPIFQHFPISFSQVHPKNYQIRKILDWSK